MNFLPIYEFHQRVERYQRSYKMKTLSCWDQFFCIALTKLTYCESPRDIQACLRSKQQKLNRIGFRGKFSRNTLAHANHIRDWAIYADLPKVLIVKARRIYSNKDIGIDLEQTIYAFYATTIALYLSLFLWAKLRQRKEVINFHSFPLLIYICP